MHECRGGLFGLAEQGADPLDEIVGTWTYELVDLEELVGLETEFFPHGCEEVGDILDLCAREIASVNEWH